MAGLFGLFGRKNSNPQPSQPAQPKDAYFLDPDSAKTFGDIDYMRKSKTVRRTFPKTASNPGGGELVQEVSSTKMAKKNPNQFGGSNSSSNINSTPSTSNNTESSPSFSDQRRNTDTNMDMFRNMAKKIKK
ncbi:hypothetical protein [Cyanobacterium aponinum]|uniref:Uncharacterized protein n=1 Tax=Cyanobacterium aponinum 0216 TaxID=2676140 RepID=A0A844GZ56_9CHRO|nr:hypothetical protein [Cyanobacterium aponinum]MTF39246.1 hypothetical protein [Cyanobacterium aponinum 0216]